MQNHLLLLLSLLLFPFMMSGFFLHMTIRPSTDVAGSLARPSFGIYLLQLWLIIGVWNLFTEKKLATFLAEELGLGTYEVGAAAVIAIALAFLSGWIFRRRRISRRKS